MPAPSPKGMWRFREHLPVDHLTDIVTLGEGDSPLIPATGPTLGSLPLGSIAFKAEHTNPTGSFKDRIASVAASLIRQRGLMGAVGTSSGNGGAAIAAYGARAGFPVVLFTVAGIVDGKLQQILAHGASAHMVEGFGERPGQGVAPTIFRMAGEAGWYPFLTGGRYAPEAMQGAETIAFEITEAHPTASSVYVPVGGGGLLASIWRGFQRTGGPIPGLVGVQPEGCPTLSRAIAGDQTPLTEPITTSVSGLQVSVLFDDDTASAVTQSGGHNTEVSDEDIWSAQALLAREEGLFVEPAGATALAGLLKDLVNGRLDRDDDVIVVLSGAGHKDGTAVARLGADNPPLRIRADEVQETFERWRRLR